MEAQAAREASAPTSKPPTPSKKSNPAPPAEETRKFTEEDVKVCREIIRCKDYYEVLGVSKSCNEADLKKAFKRKAIKVHPDKNPAPQATDAFKKVNAAMACLSDPDKRRIYD